MEALKVFSKPSYDRAFKKLTRHQQAQVKAAIFELPESVGQPHSHSGIGIRPFGKFFECRAGLQLRVLFCFDRGEIILETVGNHDDIARFVT